MTGTNDGAVPLLGLDHTGTKLSVTYVEVVHLTAGTWDRSWLRYDGDAASQQLGVPLK
jgi:hypothetical protein